LKGKITGETMESKHSSALSPTLEYRKIMIPLDGSEMSDKALMHAAYISKISGADLVILNVIETEVLSPSFTLAFLELESSRASEGKIDMCPVIGSTPSFRLLICWILEKTLIEILSMEKPPYFGLYRF